jgi:hypothetical protein
MPNADEIWVEANPLTETVPLPSEERRQHLVSVLQHWFGAPDTG